ncbi:MAG: hypothetical protein UMV23_04385 [Halanaerobium sp.]|nr:hypothetical protein [Halanaerobium sp.]
MEIIIYAIFVLVWIEQTDAAELAEAALFFYLMRWMGDESA